MSWNLGVGKGMHPVQYFCSNRSSFVCVELHEDGMTDECKVDLATFTS